MRHSSTLWAAVGALSLVAAEADLAAIPWEDTPQLDEHGFDKRQCCCQQTSTVTEVVTVTDCYIPIPEPEISTIYVDVPTTIYTTVEEIITEWETQIETQIRTTSYPVTIGVPINCVPAGEGDDTPAYPTGAEPEECSTITTTEWRTTTVLDFVTSYRPTTVPTTVEVEVPVPTTIRNTVTDYNTITDEQTITNEVTDRITTMLPGSTVTRTITSTIPADTITVTEEGTTTTRTIPGSTVVITTTEVLPGETLIITPIFDVTLCPRPTGSGEPIDYSSDETWGCKPGSVCNPPKPDGCNFWPELPTEDFRCRPEHCMVAPPYANTTWEDDESSYYPPSYGYFNLNPEAFGLSYGIFEFDVYVEKDKYTTRTITTGDWESQATLSEWPRTTSTSTTTYYYDGYPQNGRRSIHWYKRRDVTPNVCFDECDSAALIIQSLGKVPSICDPDSSFQIAYDRCADCIQDNGNSTRETIRDYVEPEFAQFFSWCDTQESTPTTTAETDGPESQVTSVEVTTETQESAVTPTFEPITTTTESEEEDEETTTSSTSTISSTTEAAPEETTTTASEEEEQPSSSAVESPEQSHEPSPEETPVETPEETPAPSPTTTGEAGESDEAESSTSYSAVTITDEDGNVSVTSSAVLVPIPADDDTTVVSPGPTPSSLPEEGEGEGEGDEGDQDEGGEEDDDEPEVVSPPNEQPTPGEPGAETPTGPDVVEPTAAATALSTSNSMLFMTLASILAAFFA